MTLRRDFLAFTAGGGRQDRPADRGQGGGWPFRKPSDLVHPPADHDELLTRYDAWLERLSLMQEMYPG